MAKLMDKNLKLLQKLDQNNKEIDKARQAPVKATAKSRPQT